MKIFKDVIVLVYFLIIISFIVYHLYYADKVIKGVYIGDISLENKGVEEAYKIVSSRLIPNDYISISVGDNFSREIKSSDIRFKYAPVSTTKSAFAVGRDNSFFQDLIIRGKGIIKKTYVDPTYTYDEVALDKLISDIQKDAGVSLVEPHFIIDKNGSVSIASGNDGYYINKDELESLILNGFEYHNDNKVVVSLEKRSPIFNVSDIESLKDPFENIMSKNFKIHYGDFSWQLSNDQILSLVTPSIDGDKVVLGINNGELKSLIQNIAVEIDRESKAQELVIENGKVVKFSGATTGFKVNQKESADLLSTALLSSTSNDVALVVQEMNPSRSDNGYGINEVIGVGTSKFAHSSSSRVHNVELAASRVNGTLVSPGEIFSFNNSVGEISRNTGYTSAWVISKGRTVLGDGGGVCQVSTTMFRAALNAGLPIIERNAHSYRVNYYEQDSGPGIDATIYSPSLDFKFKNDTNNYILIVSEFNKDDYSLKFYLYGTRDGREVEMTEPKILSRSAPPAPVYEDDSSLAPGVLKQVEYPISGANVVFDRIVKRDGQVLYEDTFKSIYRSWGAVYKRGV